ncbi:MAG: glucose-6-phosphate isomerase, partial [Brevirhabdus sp.]
MDIWAELQELAREAGDRSIAGLFSDANRAEAFSARACGLLFDYSKTTVDAHALDRLLALAQERDVPARRDAMFAGARINETENRAVLHTALRNLAGTPVMVDGADVMPEVLRTLERMEAFAHKLRHGGIAGLGGSFTDIVNIGIGGSDLGPAMVTRALSPWHDGPRLHFVSNVDGAHISDTLAGLDPTRTMVIVASKTFTTIETMTNAHTARAWMAREVENP